MVKYGILSFLIVAAVGISFEIYENYKKEKRIEEDKAVVKEKTEKFVSCIFTENIECITELFAQNKIYDAKNNMLIIFSKNDYKNMRLLNVYVERISNYPIQYEVRGMIEYDIRTLKEKEFSHKIKNLLLKYDSNLYIYDSKFYD